MGCAPSKSMSVSTVHTIDYEKGYLENELRLVLVGKTGVGKSATANTIVGTEAFKSSANAQSVTQGVQQEMCERFKRYLQVIDVPGFLDTQKDREDINREIIQCVAMASPGIHAILFIVRIGRYTEEDVKTVREFIGLFGSESKDFVIVVFTGLDDLLEEGNTLKSFVANGPDSLKQFLGEVNDRYIATANRKTKNEKEQFVADLICKVEQMVLNNDHNYYTCKMLDESEKHLMKLQKVKLEKLENESKGINGKRIEKELVKFQKELKKLRELTNEEIALRIEQKKKRQKEMISFQQQRDAREFTRKEACKQIAEESSNLNVLAKVGAGAATGAVMGSFFGPVGAGAGAIIGVAVGKVCSWFDF